MKTKTAATQLTLATRRTERLHDDAFALLGELVRLDYDSARSAAAIGHLATARESLALAMAELVQAAQVARAVEAR